jgi:hypothetical protein
MLAELATTDANVGRAPKAYVECRQDRVQPLSMKRRWQQEARFKAVPSLDTSHCPNLSAPDDLAAALIRVATTS